MFIPVEVRPSTIFGKGLFPLEDVPKGKIICSFTTAARTITEDEYLSAVENNRYAVVRTGTRYVGKYFTCTDDTETDLNFFNHSFDPNLLVHCGVVIAMRHVPAGTELTIDYCYLIDDTDVGIYNDAASGKAIRGLPARRTLIETARKMIEIMEDLDDAWQG